MLAAPLFLSADDLDRLFHPADVRDALASAFRTGVSAPPRQHHEIGSDGTAVHLLMPAWTAGAPGPGCYLGTKIVNVFRDNAVRGLPAVLGLYVLQDGETGAPLAVIDGTRLTHWRTAAASALASSFLSRRDSRRMVMVGAGALAPFLIAAHAAARPIDDVCIWNHRPDRAARVARDLDRVGLRVRVADQLENAVREADLVCCATLSSTSLIEGAWLRPGQHIDLVGAFTLAMREADDPALRRARIFVDTDHALHEGGDVAVALKSGAIQQSDVQATLLDLCRGGHPGRQADDEITLFKSVGSAIEDLAAAILAQQLATAPEQASLSP